MLKQRVCGSRTQGPNVRDPESHGGSLAALQMNFRAAQWCLAVHNCPVHIQHLSTFCAAQPKDGRKPLIGIPFPF